MALEKYKEKRNFKETSEPSGKVKGSKSKLIFVVQRHKASHLHYDFRLELDGVLKSWAVPKGPSMNPKDKRLAMMVEDHPYDYKDFAGIIPEGNYGAGIVEIWDHGTYSDIENSSKKEAEKNLNAGLKKGDLKVHLYGKKLKGEFVLVDLKKDEKSWLLIKHRDEYATDEDYNSEDETPKSSPINKALKKEEEGKKRKAEKKKQQQIVHIVPEFMPANPVKPMLAKETSEAFDDDNWVFEIKWDGYRAIAEKGKKGISLYSRNGNNFSEKYPAIVHELEKIPDDVIIDGEIVVLNDEGHPDFQMLQHYSDYQSQPIQFQVFDILQLKGKDLTHLPLLQRKETLRKILPESDVIRYCDHISQNGIAFFESAKKADLEGIMAKKSDSEYFEGKRTSEWLKIKNHKSTEAIIAGYTAPAGSRKFFGALILADRQNGKLVYIGHTGTGFNHKSLKEFFNLMQPLVTEKSPFAEKIKTNSKVTWVRPELVCEIKYTEMTKDGKIRHPVFLRLRDDKSAGQVNNENLKTGSSMKSTTKTVEANAPTTKRDSTTNKPAAGQKAASAKKASGSKKKVTKTGSEKKIFTFGKNKVEITHPDKMYFPKDEITKGEIAEYYQSISKFILPYLKGRPESLLRHPNGIDAKPFFHKDAGEKAPSYVASKEMFSESTNKDIDYIICNNAATLAYMNNLGCIEINPWHSTVDKPDYPDYFMIDIDPSEKNTFDQVIEVANAVKEIMDSVGESCYCKTSGASGMHVYIPAGKKYTYEQVKDFANLVCLMIHDMLPGFTSLERNLKKRGNKVIYLDYLQNRRGQTLASVYSARPKPGATVSTPLKWEEVKKGLLPSDFTIYNTLERIKKEGDLFKGIFKKGIDIEKCLEKFNR